LAIWDRPSCGTPSAHISRSGCSLFDGRSRGTGAAGIGWLCDRLVSSYGGAFGDGRFGRDGLRRLRWPQWFVSNLIEDLFPVDRHGSRCTDAEADLPAGLHAEHGDRHFIADAHRFPDPSSQDQNRSSLPVRAAIGPSMSDATRWNIKSRLCKG
jgi:hypothetical protein